MKNFSIAFVLFLCWSFFGLWLYANATTVNIPEVPTKNNLKDSISTNTATIQNLKKDSLVKDSIISLKKIKPKKLEGLVIYSEQNKPLFHFSTGIIITKNKSAIEIPKQSIDFKYKINSYLLEHPNTEVHIISNYDATEQLNATNLGIKRSQNIKKILTQTGVNEKHIVVKSMLKTIAFKDNSYTSGVQIQFHPLDIERVNALNLDAQKPITFYPEYSYKGIQENQELKNLLAKIIKITNDNPDITIEIIGHTDNIGNDNDNFKTALENARQLRWYIINKGSLTKNTVKASSKGENEPIASNGTKKGRLLNQRLEIIFH